MTPLTPTERAALDAAKAELREARDAWNLETIDHCLAERAGWLDNPGSLEKSSVPIYAEEEYMIAHAYERAIEYLATQMFSTTILARQVAERLTIG